MEAPIVLRPRIKILIYIFATLFALIIICGLLSNDSIERYILLILFLSAVLTILLLFVYSQKIILNNNFFFYNNGKEKITVSWDTVIKSEIIFYGKWGEPMLKLYLSAGNFYLIRLALYSGKDARLFIQKLLSKASTADHSEDVRHALNAKFFS